MVYRRVTLKDVARHIGVNTSTVSRALNPATKSMITPDKVKQIEDAARELGYVQNAMASALRKGRTMTIGIIAPDLMNPVFPPILQGIFEVLKREGYTPIVAYCENDRQLALEELLKIKSHQVDGFILAGVFREDETVDYCLKFNIPVVTVGRSLDKPIVDQVIVNNELGMKLVFNHLIEYGHRNIVHLAGPQEISDGYQRVKLFRELATENNLDNVDKKIVHAVSFTQKGGYEATLNLIESGEPFTAILAGNDLIALGCMEALKDKGYRCPEDVSVTGYNNMPYLEYFSCPLTTVSIQRKEMGVSAAILLLGRIADADLPLRSIVIDPELAIRKSSRPVS